MKKTLDLTFRILFLCIYVLSLAPAPVAVAAPEIEPVSTPEIEIAAAPVEPAQEENNPLVVPPQNFRPKSPLDVAQELHLLGYTLPSYSTYDPQNGLSIEPLTAYNLVVDSNVLSPSSYGPSAATFGARYCNTNTTGDLTDVWAYIGNYDKDYDGAPGDPDIGTFPIRRETAPAYDPAAFAAAYADTSTNPLVDSTLTDYGATSTPFALKLEAGSSTTLAEGARYIGTLAPGQCRTEYWLISYPRKACSTGTVCDVNNSSREDVTGNVKPEDDLWLPYFFWGTSTLSAATKTSYRWNVVTMRNEISAMANKIWPNGDNKVPDEYVTAIQQVLGWDTWTPNGSGTTAYPGETVVSQGIWYDLGNVGAGFDNNGDLVPDRNAWLQPIGDAGSYDPGCFRLIRTYGLVIVKLNDGTEMLIPFVDRMYFENIPDNNNGAVGLVFYEYMALDGVCTAGLTPYQEVASGYDNEKFNADFGAGIPPLQSQETNMTLDKSGQPVIGLDGQINYSLTFTLPDVNTSNTQVITVGNPSTGAPLTFSDSVPVGLRYVGGSASTTVDMSANYTLGDIPATVLFSKDGGTTWQSTDPGDHTSTSASDQLVIQWQLQSGVRSPASGPAYTGTVTFSAVPPAATYTEKVIKNTACLRIGLSPSFFCDEFPIVIAGNSAITGTVFKDIGTTGGVAGNGVQDGAEAGIGDTAADTDTTGVTVKLYWDANGDGDYDDAGDFLYATTTTDSNGNYCFGGTGATCTPSSTAGLAATGSTARYIIVVDPADVDVTGVEPNLTGYGPTTVTSYTKVALAANTLYGDATDGSEPSDFGFAPALWVEKRRDTASPVTEGGTVQFTLTATNTLPGSGTRSATCSYYVWAGEVYPTTWGGAPDGGGPANSQFQVPTNATGRPDERYAYSVMNDNTDTLGLGGYKIANMGGNITSVQYVVNVHERVDLSTSDRFFVNTYYNDVQEESVEYYGNGTWEVDNVAQTPATTYFNGGTGTEYVITRTLDPNKITNRTDNTWQWTDFRATNGLELQVQANKGSSSGDVNLDAAGFIITTDGTCGGTASTILNPVPLVDEFDNRYLQFVSAVPPISSQSTSGDLTTLSWANVGPLYPGETKSVTVTFLAKDVSASVTTINKDESTGAKFVSGASANSDLRTETNNQADVTIDPYAQISGYVWQDQDNAGWEGTNGYDSSDLLLSGVTVRLYACQYPAGTNLTTSTYDPTEPCTGEQGGNNKYGTWGLISTTTTDANGYYSFGNLSQGFYITQVVPSNTSGQLPTTATQRAEAVQNSTGVTCTNCNNYWEPAGAAGSYLTALLTTTNFNYLSPAEEITRVNFGYVLPAGIAGTVWHDYDGDGVIDTSEPPISGVTVYLCDSGDTAPCTAANANASYTTGADGKYIFTGLTAGTQYFTGLSANPAGYNTHTYDPDNGTTNPDRTSGLVTAVSNQTLSPYNFGFRNTGSYVIGDTLFYDWDGQGDQDSGVDEGINNVDVLLYADLDNDGVIDSTDPLVSTQSTDASGMYCFGGSIVGGICTAGTSALPAGNYIVKVNTGDAQFPASVNQTKDPGETGVCVTCDSLNKISLSASNFDQDFGYKPNGSGYIGDTVFKDSDGSGTQGTTEAGISGVTVELQVDLNGDGTYVTIATDVTDSSGKYLFTGLPAGTYRVKIDLDNTPYANATAIPNDGYGYEYTPSTGTTSTAGMVYLDKTLATSTSYDLSADFGFAPLASFGDTVYQDINNNGTQDFSEPGISGLTVTLYTFTDVGDGDKVYDLGEPFFDLDGDGVRDTNEPFFDKDGRYQPGETIGATAVATTTTNANGIYHFAGLTPGYYVAEVTPPASSVLTGDPNTDGVSCTTLTASTEPPYAVCDNRDGMRLYNGTNYTGADFGYLMGGAFGDRVWIDTDGDRISDPGESGLANITVTAVTTDHVTVNGVDYPAGTTLTTVTDVNGYYSFQNILPVGDDATWTVTVDTSDLDFTTGLVNTTEPDQLTSCDIAANPTCTGYNSETTVVMDTSGVVTAVGVLADNDDDGDASDPLNLDVDFGYRFAGATSISGTICLDITTDGVCGDNTADPSGVGANESAYNNVTVYLYKLDDTDGDGELDPGETTVLVGTTITSASGDYAFNNVADGEYYIVAIGTPQDGLTLTSSQTTVNGGGDDAATTSYVNTLAGDGDTLSAYQVIDTTGDTSVTDRDFAFKLKGSYDFGDLPATYATTLAGVPDGARHLIPDTPTLFFGPAGATQASLVDSDGAPTADATGDGDDENGVAIPNIAANDSWADGTGTLQFDIVGSGWLIGWVDINKDGDFADANEMVLSTSVTSGQDQNFNISTPTTDGYYYMRFRLFTSKPGVPALAYSGATTGGEVEDYRIGITGGTPTPITLAYFKAVRDGSRVDFTWSTATEIGNIGFNLYVEENSQLIQINANLIPSQMSDSLKQRDYSYSLNVAGDTFYIEDVDILGEGRMHGPYEAGQEYGNLVEETPTDHASIRAEHAEMQASRQNELKQGLKVPADALRPVTVGRNGASDQLTTTLNFKVNKTGIYRVTYAMLRDAGLDLAGVPSAKITLTNRGQRVPIYVSALSKFGPSAFIEFYGEALDTIYTDTNVYTLQVSRTVSSRVQKVSAAPAAVVPAASYTETVSLNNQNAYAYYAPGKDAWYDTSLVAFAPAPGEPLVPVSKELTFQVNDLAKSTPATLELVLWGVTNWAGSPDHHVQVSLNGVLLADQVFDGLVERRIRVSLPPNALREGTNTLKVTALADQGFKYHMVNVDKFSVSYQRSFKALDGRLTFTSAGKTFKVTNLPGKNVVVYRKDNSGIVRLNGVVVTASGSTFTASFAGTGRKATYIVTASSALYKPVLEATRLNKDLNQRAQYLIISHPDFIAGLEPLVQARQAQGLSVSVVDVNDLYTQYGYGIFDPQAIKQYIAHAAQNLGTQYVLLVGGDTYDYRNYLGKGSLSFIPSLYYDTGLVTNFVPVDPLYTDLDGDNLPDLAIGRFPVRTTAELNMMVNKTLAYGTKDYPRTAVFAADKFDNTVSFKAISIGLAAGMPADWDMESIYLDDFATVDAARDQLLAAMNRGTALVTYTGHSSASAWTLSNSFFTTKHAPTLTNTGRPFVVLQWGCWNNYYVDPSGDYLVQSFLFSGEQGAAATLGASTLTDSDSERLLGELLGPRLVTPGTTIGSALQDAKRELAKTDPDLLDVLLGWTLMGDPAMVIEP